MGGVKNNRLNRIDNLYALCRKCHTLGHSDKELNEQWKKDLLERIEWKKENPDGW
jgi:tellurite resistance protein